MNFKGPFHPHGGAGLEGPGGVEPGDPEELLGQDAGKVSGHSFRRLFPDLEPRRNEVNWRLTLASCMY